MRHSVPSASARPASLRCSTSWSESSEVVSAAKKVTLVEEEPDGSASKWREAVRLRDSAVCGKGSDCIGNHAVVNHCYKKSRVLFSEGEISVGIGELLDTYSNTGKHRYSARVCECHVTCRHTCCDVLCWSSSSAGARTAVRATGGRWRWQLWVTRRDTHEKNKKTSSWFLCHAQKHFNLNLQLETNLRLKYLRYW